TATIDARVLPELTVDDLKELGVVAVGHRRLLLNAMAALRTDDGAAVKGAASLLTRSAEAERRVLTVMFCDPVGSTQLSARLTRRIYARLSPPIMVLSLRPSPLWRSRRPIHGGRSTDLFWLSRGP